MKNNVINGKPKSEDNGIKNKNQCDNSLQKKAWKIFV